MAQKIELQTADGRTIKVMPHMLSDLLKFGCTETKRVFKNPPAELLEKKTIITAKVPDLKLEPEPMKTNLPEMEVKPVVKVVAKNKGGRPKR